MLPLPAWSGALFGIVGDASKPPGRGSGEARQRAPENGVTHLLRAFGDSVAEFGQEMPRILWSPPVDFGLADDTTALLGDAVESFEAWLDSIARYCTN